MVSPRAKPIPLSRGSATALVALDLDAVALELPIEIRALELQRLGRARYVAATPLERRENVPALEVVARVAQRRVGRNQAVVAAELRRKILDADRRTRRE